MPTLYYHVEAPGVNILNTVTDQAVGGLLNELGLTPYFKDSVYILNQFTASSQYDDGSGAINLIKNRCDVNVSYVLDKSQVPWPVETPYTTTAYGIRSDKKGTHTPILSDVKSGIFIEHYTVACAANMDFVLTFQTYDDATRAIDTIQTKYKGSLIQSPFDLSFSYPVSMSLFEYLVAVFKAKTDYQSKTLLDYLKDVQRTEISFDIRKSQLTDPNADKELMIRCQQLRCLAQLTMDQKEPETDRIESLPDSYKISFNMVLQFGRPNLIAVNTPISVDNTLLPDALFANVIANYHYNPYVHGLYQDTLCSDFMKRTYGNYNYASQIIRFPIYDDWFSVDRQYAYFEYRPLLIAHFTLDGPTSTIDLKQLSDIQLHPVVLDILKRTGNAVFNYGGLFNIGVYAGDLRLGSELVSLSDDLILTITSSRPDKVYHLMLSETTNLKKTDVAWDPLLIEYRYFFPLTIERNLQSLIDKRYFFIAYDDSLLTLISNLEHKGKLKTLLQTMVSLGECTNAIYSYTQNPSQLAEYLTATQSLRTDYAIPTGTDATSVLIQQYYSTIASIQGRSLFVAFIEQCLIGGYTTLNMVPSQYLKPNQTTYPYSNVEGGFYGFNTPLRVLNYTIRPEQRSQ